MDLYNDTYLPDILHGIAQGLLTPVMVLIVALIAVTLFFLGSVIVESSPSAAISSRTCRAS